MLWRAVEKCRKHDSFGRCRVWCVALDKRGRIIAEAGNNYLQTHPVQYRAAKRVGLEQKCYLHAEILCCLQSLKTGVTIDTLVVARVDKAGKVCDGKPCIVCQGYIAQVEQMQGSSIDIVYSKGEN